MQHLGCATVLLCNIIFAMFSVWSIEYICLKTILKIHLQLLLAHMKRPWSESWSCSSNMRGREHAVVINHFHISLWTMGKCLGLARKYIFQGQEAVFDEVSRERHQCAFVSLAHLWNSDFKIKRWRAAGGGWWLQRSKS